MPEIECSDDDFAPFAPVGTAASLGLLGAGHRKPWPFAIEHQRAEITFDVPSIHIR